MTRSTMLTTDTSGSALATFAYTAFGEPVTYDSGSQSWQVGFPADIGSRYGYDGGWGYESGLLTLWGEDTSLPPVTLQHVGERWYQPGIGRFIQRDPIGLGGGFNCYSYCDADPSTCVDPVGLAGNFFGHADDFLDGVIRGDVGSGVSATAGLGMAANYKWKLGIGRLVNRTSAICAGVWFGWRLGKYLDEDWHPGSDDPWHEAIGEWIYWGGGEGEYSRQGNGEIRLD